MATLIPLNLGIATGDGSSSATTVSSRNVSGSTAPTSLASGTPVTPQVPTDVEVAHLRDELAGWQNRQQGQDNVEHASLEVESEHITQENDQSTPSVPVSEKVGAGEGAFPSVVSDHDDHPPAPSNVESKTIQPNEGPSSSTEPGHVNNLSATLVPEPESGPSGDAGPRPAESEPLHSENVSPPNNGAANQDPPQKGYLLHRLTGFVQSVKQKVSNIVFVKRHNGHSARDEECASQQ